MRAALEVQHMRGDRPFTPGAGPNGGDFFLPWQQLQREFAASGVGLHTRDLHAGHAVDFELHLNVQRQVAAHPPHYVFVYEDPLVRPINAAMPMLARYRKVFTWSPDQQQHLPNAVALDYPNDLTARDTPGWQGRDLHCVMLASNKALRHADPRSLHDARVAVIRAFERLAPGDFSLYGQGWDIPAVRPGPWGRVEKRVNEWLRRWRPAHRPFASFRGKVHRKSDVLDRARFAIAYENSRGSPGYLTEKVFGCFASGCVPVYIGAPGWQQVIPASACIDGDRFADPAELVAFLGRVTPAQFAAYQAAGRDFLAAPSTQRFSNEHFCRVLVSTILDDLRGLAAG